MFKYFYATYIYIFMNVKVRMLLITNKITFEIEKLDYVYTY